MRSTVSVISDALRLYGTRSLAVSFSGGKEACVMLFLLKYCMQKAGLDERALSTELRILYFSDSDTFPEVAEFLTYIRQYLDVEFVSFSCSYREGMAVAVESGVRAVLMGVRVGDPHACAVEHFQPSSTNWPAFMRINPVMHWRYGEGIDSLLDGAA